MSLRLSPLAEPGVTRSLQPSMRRNSSFKPSEALRVVETPEKLRSAAATAVFPQVFPQPFPQLWKTAARRNGDPNMPVSALADVIDPVVPGDFVRRPAEPGKAGSWSRGKLPRGAEKANTASEPHQSHGDVQWHSLASARIRSFPRTHRWRRVSVRFNQTTGAASGPMDSWSGWRPKMDSRS